MGASVTVASPKGDQPPLDPKSDEADAQTPSTTRFNQDTAGQAVLAPTDKLGQVNATNFDAVFYPGGHGYRAQLFNLNMSWCDGAENDAWSDAMRHRIES